jgi:DnaD/phage-associated family protein
VTFAGFPARAQATAIPHVFFADVLPRLAHDPVALGVTLYALQALQRKKGFPRFLSASELVCEPAVLSYLMNCDRDERAVDDGLRVAADIGVLLPLPIDIGSAASIIYFLNAPADRRALEAVRSGTVEVAGMMPQDAPPPALARGSIFALYESLIGTISPLVSEELTEAERLYPQPWIERAFREAAAQNARSWRYVSRILERWAAEGPDHEEAHGDPPGDARYFRGRYGRILQQRLRS